MPNIKEFLTICKSCQSPHIALRVSHHLENPVSFDLLFCCTMCQMRESIHFDPPIINRKEAIQLMVEASKVAQS